MKRLLLLTAIFLSACGLSPEEKKNIAAVTCSIMSETRNMDGAVRVEKMNDARVKIGGEPFLDGDEAIKESFEYELCQELVLNETYNETLQSLKEEEQRLAAERYASVEDTFIGEWVFEDQTSIIFKRGGVGEFSMQAPSGLSEKMENTKILTPFGWNINIEDSPFHLDIHYSEVEIPSLKVIFEVNDRKNLRMGFAAEEGKRPKYFSEADEIVLGTRR